MGKDGVEICLVTSSGSGRWGIPKGIIDRGESPTDTALKETVEEAGLSGYVHAEPVATYKYRKWGMKLTVSVHLMEVDHEDDDWPEKPFRRRLWTSVKNALKLLDGHPARDAVAQGVKQLVGD
jgi:8-oxo-dGTP pyrophosphatase MutT (NUDIX family)